MKLLVFFGSIGLFAAVALLLGRPRAPSAAPRRQQPEPNPPPEEDEEPARCARCRSEAERLIPTQEGFLCSACYDEAK